VPTIKQTVLLFHYRYSAVLLSTIINHEHTEPLMCALRTRTANVPRNTVHVFPHPIPYLQ